MTGAPGAQARSREVSALHAVPHAARTASRIAQAPAAPPGCAPDVANVATRRIEMNGVIGIEATWEPGRSVPLAGILGLLRRGAGDPTMVVVRGQVWWAPVTPEGIAATWWRTERAQAASLGEARDRVGAQGEGRGVPSVSERVVMCAFGPGAAWVAARMARILGDEDDVSGFAAHHPPVENALRRPCHLHWRVPRTGLVITSLVPSILEQKVTGKQAFGGFRELVRGYGTPARFPADVVRRAGEAGRQVSRMQAAPSAEQWRRIPSWAWLQAGVEPPQSRTVMRALAHAERLEETASLPLTEAHQRLRSIPGLGVWTAAKVAQTAWGDPDSPTYADYHVAKQIGHALLGRDVDDDGMARLLEPYRGHRYRAEHLILAGGASRERRGARMSLPTHLPTRANRW